MPLTGNEAGVRQLRRDVEQLGKGEILLAGARTEVKSLLREQFDQGIGPDGTPLQETVRHRPALISRKLPNAFGSRIDQGALRFTAKSTRDLLEAHQEGHVFKARKVAAQKQFLTFDRRGRMIKNSRALNKKGEVKRGVHQTFGRAHTVGERVLPARPIAPGPALPARYEQAIERGVTAGVMRWHDKASR
jgi:hypothetical protein